VKARARGEENSIPLQYLQELHDLHDEWLLGSADSKFKVPAQVIVIDANKDKEEMLVEYKKQESVIFNKLRSGMKEKESGELPSMNLRENLVQRVKEDCVPAAV
jgi:hypothetical protein